MVGEAGSIDGWQRGSKRYQAVPQSQVHSPPSKGTTDMGPLVVEKDDASGSLGTRQPLTTQKCHWRVSVCFCRPDEEATKR
jgi:hypothetical protein